MEKSKVAALYVRVSTEKQVDHGYSLEAQENVLRDKAISQGKIVSKVYKDAGVSGAKMDRLALTELLHDAQNGNFGSVYVWSFDRIARNLLGLLSIANEFHKADVQLISINENFDVNTPEGRFLLGFYGNIAQSQRETFRANSMLGSRKKAESGKFVGGSMLGYRRVPDETDSKMGTKLVIDENEACIVRTIFELYCSGYGLKAVASRVNRLGMRGKKGKEFSITTVRGILTNRAYIGMVKYAGEYFMGVHEPIIDKELWDKAQSLLASKNSYTKVIDYQYLLSGLIKCPICSCGMLPSHSSRKTKDGTVRYTYYYVCGKYMNKGAGSCISKAVRAKEADTIVMEFLTKHLSSKAWKDTILSEVRRKISADSKVTENIKNLKAGLQNLKNKQTQLLLKYEDGNLEKDCLLRELANIKTEIKQIETQLVPLDTCCGTPSYTERDIMEALKKLPALIKKATYQEKLKLLRGVVRSVDVDSNMKVSGIEVLVPVQEPHGKPLTLKIKL